MSLRSQLSAAYKRVYALLIAQRCRDWREDKVIEHATFLYLQIDIHHVFPQKWCNDNYVSTPTGKRSSTRRRCLSVPTSSCAKLARRLRAPAQAYTHMPAAQVNELISEHLIYPSLLRAAYSRSFSRCGVKRSAC